MTEKRQTSQGYIIRILQHFATKLQNITNFVMLFQAVMKFLSRLIEIKIYYKGERSIEDKSYCIFCSFVQKVACLIFHIYEVLLDLV